MDRTETRHKRARESTFAYYNASAREPVAAVRVLLQQWFDTFPTRGKEKKDLLARFRSPTDSQHLAAFWELYLHELLSRIGFRLEPHPAVEGSPNHPDFLVFEGRVPKFYLEATLAGLPAEKDAAGDARLAEVLDLVNRMATPNYFLEVQHRGRPNTQPPTRKLRRDLEKWLASQDPDRLDAMCRAGDFGSLPRFEWSHDGLTIFFAPIPKSPTRRGTTDARPIGITMGEGHQPTTDRDIRDAIDAKAKKYGALSLPLVIASNVVSEHCDDIDINNALFGSEAFQVTLLPNGSLTEGPGQREPNGAWFGRKGPRNGFVSAVLIGCDVRPYTSGRVTPVLIHNPYPINPLVLSSYPLPQSVPDAATRKMKRKEGKKASDYLRLPTPWPPPMD